MSHVPAAVALLLFAPAADLQLKPTDWPQFRGPHRNGYSDETGLLKKWPDGGPPKVWTATGLGGGYSSVSVAGGLIFATGLKSSQQHVFALDETTGREKWSTPIGEPGRGGGYEGPRSTPTFANGKVYAVGMGGELVCCAAQTGKIVWEKNYVQDFGGQIQNWGYAESVLVDDGKVIGVPCSKSAAVVALNADTGDVVWKATVPNAGSAGGYSSAVKAEVGGVPLYVTLLGNSGGVVAVHAKTGQVLWTYTKMMNGTANIPSPVVHGDHVFVSTGYGAGAALLKMTKSGDGVSVKEVKFYQGRDLQNHHGGMVPIGDALFLGNQHNSGLPACVDLTTGEIKWKETRGAGGGSGSAATAAADGMVYFRYQNGVVALVKADPNAFELVSSFKIPEPSGKPSWPHPAIANGKLYLRDQDKLHCFNLKAN